MTLQIPSSVYQMAAYQAQRLNMSITDYLESLVKDGNNKVIKTNSVKKKSVVYAATEETETAFDKSMTDIDKSHIITDLDKYYAQL